MKFIQEKKLINNYFDQNSLSHTKENNHIIITEKSEKENNVKVKEYEETVSHGNNRKETNKTSDMINLREKGQYGRRLDYKPSGCVSRSIGGTQKTVTNMHQFYNSMLSSSSSTSSTSSQIEHFQTPSRVNQIQSQTHDSTHYSCAGDDEVTRVLPGLLEGLSGVARDDGVRGLDR